jgi:glycosyltransferase involved in cell wall biosynthesis
MDSLDAGCHSGRISVCMATYNGSAFVQEQLASILAQIGPSDEVIVVDDASTDDTAAVVAAVVDTRVRLLRSSVNKGHVRTFEKAISAASGEYIFLADQDDLWVRGRVDVMRASLGRRPVVAGNFTLLGNQSETSRSRLLSADSGAGLKNIYGILVGTRSYFGCAMAFRRDLLPILLPIPCYAEAHDLWLAAVGNLVGGVEHCEDSVLLRRLHENNLTPNRRRSLRKILVSRILMLRAMVEILRRRSRSRRP